MNPYTSDINQPAIPLPLPRFSLFVALRHLVTAKRIHATNAMAWIAMGGVAISAMALVVVLSVFNGIESLVSSMYSSWDTDLKVVPAHGKVIHLDSAERAILNTLPAGSRWGLKLEENALLGYRDRQHLGSIVGIDTTYASIVNLAQQSVEGLAALYRGSQPLAIITRGVAYYLGATPALYDPLTVYIPNRTAKNWLNPETAFGKKRYAFDAIISVNAEFDTKSIVLPIGEVQRMLHYDSCVASGIMIDLPHAELVPKVQQQLEHSLGDGYKVLNRLAQNATLYKTMRSERLIIIVILSLILLIATFNIVGSLSMLVIEKQDEIRNLWYMGAERKQVRRIFLLDGLLISLSGGGIGVLLGLFLCWLQEQFGLIALHGSGSFVVDAYPVDVHGGDVFLIVGLVGLAGFLASLVPLNGIQFREKVGRPA